ncbi:YgiW/YdeI family stress tolerance OB fold protein [[Pasteurella] aerogenes]
MMKKISLATILVLSTVSIVASANYGSNNDTMRPGYCNGTQGTQAGNCTGPRMMDGHHRGGMRAGGFMNSNQPVANISQQDTWKDDQYIVLQGKIVEQVGKDDYRIKDASGEMVVEIERGAWSGQDVSPNDEVKLYGEVDKSWNKTEVEIHRVEKVQ